MSKIIFGAIVAAATCVTATAQAADMYGRRPYSQPYTVNQPLANSWMGPYIGGNLGYGWGDVSNNGARPSGVLGGLQAGYNYQSGQLVLGIEGDLQLNSADDTFAAWKFSNPWFGTVRGRLGYAFDRFLPYVTGGLAVGDVKTSATGFGSSSSTKAGWTLGGGVERMIGGNWLARVDYRYAEFGAVTQTFFAEGGTGIGFDDRFTARVKARTHTATVGLAYRF